MFGIYWLQHTGLWLIMPSLCVQDQSRKRATAGGPLSWISSLLVTAMSFLALAMLFALGAGAIRRYSGAGAGALAGGPATSITGAGGASYAPKEFNKVTTWPDFQDDCVDLQLSHDHVAVFRYYISG